LNKNNIFNYLANKYWIGIFFLGLIFIIDKPFLKREGFVILAVICVLLAISQVISFNSLARTKPSTHSVIKQTKIIFMLIIALFLNQVTNMYAIISIFFIFYGGLLITRKEIEESSNKKDTLTGIFLCLTTPLFAITISYLLEYAFNLNYFSPSTYSIFSILTIIILFNSPIFKKNKSQKQNISQFTKKELYLLQLAGVLSIGVNITNALAIKQMGVVFTEIISALAPIVILIFAVLSKQEKLTLTRVLGVVVTITGVVIFIVSS
jgi:drug/metabolite transporter (DMT)-like permease